MARATVLGMTIDAREDDPIVTGQPLAAVVIVKMLDEDGDVTYVTGATEGLMSVEALGMARYAQLKLERGMAQRMDDEE